MVEVLLVHLLFSMGNETTFYRSIQASSKLVKKVIGIYMIESSHNDHDTSWLKPSFDSFVELTFNIGMTFSST
jgi:hypothetical protein